MFEAMSSVVQVRYNFAATYFQRLLKIQTDSIFFSPFQIIGDGETRKITLTHQTQTQRFASDLFKLLRAQPNRSLHLSMLPQAYLSTYNRVFEPTDYGVCDVEDLLDGLRGGGFITVTKKRDESDDVCMYIQKRRQSNLELETTASFAGEVVELLRNAPQYSIPFRKFVRSYHYYFGYQCKLSDYGFMRLADLLEALSGIVEMDQKNEENRKIFLSRKVALRVFGQQIHEVIKELTGQTRLMLKVDEVMETHKVKYGYQMQGSSLGYDSVIDALKFVPFIELSSFENELWITSHLSDEKFRLRAMLACLTVIDIGNKAPLSKFHAIFSEKYKFNISEKQLHAMKHAIEIEMVNGIKMISVTQMMKFLLHVVNILEQKKRITIQQIKSIMKLSLNSTFYLGFPNVSSIIVAYPDIFVVCTEGGAGEKIHHERYDVELNQACPSKSFLIFTKLNFGSTFTKYLYSVLQSGLKTLLNQKRVQLPDEKPEMYYKPKINPIQPPTMRCVENPQQPQHKFQQANADNPSHRNVQLFNDQHNSPFMMGRGDMTMSTTMPTEFVNQMINCACQRPQYLFHPNQCVEVPSYNPSFYERNLKLQHQQQFESMKRDFYNSSSSTGYSSSSSSSLSAYEANMQQQYAMMSPSSFYTRFDPPKPDTPPSKPLWLDPVWNCDGNFLDNRNAGASSSTSFGNSDSVRFFMQISCESFF